MSWLAIAISLLVIFMLVLPVVALLIPQGRTVARSVHIEQPAEAVWSVITDFAGQVAWRPDLLTVEPLSDRSGNPVWREVRRTGPALAIETALSDPPRRLVRRLADPELAFGGSWIFDLEPRDGGCVLTLTEKAEIYNPLLRIAAYAFLHDAVAVETYLVALTRKLQEDTEIRDVG